jgi:DNA-binding MarR family transcriptional regulator
MLVSMIDKKPIILSETYLYKIHALSNLLDKAFDRTLRLHVDITLSQFLVLAAVAEKPGSNQRQIARYLEISAVAVKRQIDIAKRQGWLIASAQTGRGEALGLTVEGNKVVEMSLQTLEKYVFRIFDGHNESLNLMQHIDMLHKSTKDAVIS